MRWGDMQEKTRTGTDKYTDRGTCVIKKENWLITETR
jgi:hypothetical protein